jgi:hypothetical protein
MDGDEVSIDEVVDWARSVNGDTKEPKAPTRNAAMVVDNRDE